ncbi:hypothetical protein JD844_013014 [Phrynosoma platyrhinos]|uniref:Uncharacterized protein n=1 Tax=Phrynosoma platyrhinos TaxID=52577 RepID=A0ABQ7TK97_PHRPL|nr:hypothetical protein JD844_013014 [Phrynosoma platyrhinos]
MKHNREEPQDATTPASKKQKNEQAVSDSSNLYQCFEARRKKATTLSACFAEMQKMVVKGCEILRRAKGYEAHLNYMWNNPVTQTHIDAFYESIKRYNQYILNRSIEHRQIGRGKPQPRIKKDWEGKRGRVAGYWSKPSRGEQYWRRRVTKLINRSKKVLHTQKNNRKCKGV